MSSLFVAFVAGFLTVFRVGKQNLALIFDETFKKTGKSDGSTGPEICFFFSKSPKYYSTDALSVAQGIF